MSYDVRTADVRDNFRTAAHLIAKANGAMKMEGGREVPDLSKIDLTQLTQGYVFTMCDIQPTQQQMQFPIVDTQQVANAPINPMMRLLSMQDSFVATSMSYFLMVFPFSGSQQNPIFTSPDYNLTPITYPAAFHNGNQLGAGFELMDPGCGLFWNPGSYISIEVDKKVVIPYWDCLKHMYVPQTQASQTPNPVLGPPNQWPQVQDQYDGATSAAYPIEPVIVFGGGRQNLVKLNLPANVPATIAPFNIAGYGTSFIAKACLKFNGILAQNSTSVK